MSGAAGFDQELFQAHLTNARSDLEQDARELTQSADQGRAYDVFEKALTAAGYARALGKPEAAVRELLRTAADAAALVFRLRGTLQMRVTDLDTTENEVFTDTSMTNPWTFARAFYAALAGRAEKTLSYLSSLAPRDYHSEQVEVPRVLSRYCEALRRTAAGDPGAAAAMYDLPKDRGERSTMEDRFWFLQASALDRLLSHDSAGFQTRLRELSEVLDAYDPETDQPNDPDRFLKLPTVGLAALAERLLGLS